MAHQGTTQGRILAPPPLPQSKTTMDPTHKKNPIFNSTTTTKNLHPTSQDSTFAPPSTIHHISNHFSKLYANHKVLASSKSTNGISHLQAKALSDSTLLDSSCTTLTKSNSQHERNVGAIQKQNNSFSRTKIKEKDKKGIKKPHQDVKQRANNYNELKKSSSQKEFKGKVFFEEQDLKKASMLMSTSLEIDDQLKGNFEERCEVRRASMSFGVNWGRRKSFCCSKTEMADFFSGSGVKIVAVDMPPFMQIHAVDCARKTHDSLEKFTSKTLALTLKKEFDGIYGPAWHCIVGTSFGSFVTHSVGGFMYFSMDHKLYILLFKTTVQKAD